MKMSDGDSLVQGKYIFLYSLESFPYISLQFVVNLLSDPPSIIDPVKNYSGEGLG